MTNYEKLKLKLQSNMIFYGDITESEPTEITDSHGNKLNVVSIEVGEPMLNDVLLYYSIDEISMLSRFEVKLGEAHFTFNEYSQAIRLQWDLKKIYLKDQSPELIEWLNNIC